MINIALNPIIESFCESISWADECRVLEIAGIDFLCSRLCLYLPCALEEADEALHLVRNLADEVSLRPALLIDGEPTSAEIERIITSNVDVHKHFISVQASVTKHEIICKMFDGIDWGRTITKALSGDRLAVPVMVWD